MMDPDQVEAHAAQGYSTADVARLLGAPFFSSKDNSSARVMEAYERGSARWRDAGAPIPPRATDIIAQAVHSRLLLKEMARPELKEALGFRYDDLNLAIETLEGQFLIDHEEDSTGKTYYRGAGTRSLIAEKRRSAPGISPERIADSLPSGNNDVNEMSQPTANPNGDSELTENKPEKISARSEVKIESPAEPARDFEVFDRRRGPTYKVLDLLQVENLMATEETVAKAAKKLGMTNAQLYQRRQRDKQVADAVDRGRRRYYDGLNGDESKEKVTRSQSTSETTKFGISVNTEIRRIVETLPVGTETDTPRLLTLLLAVHPNLQRHPELKRLKTYITQAVSPLKGKLLELLSKGKGGKTNVLRRVDGQHVVPDQRLVVSEQRLAVRAQRTTSTEVYGDVRVHEEIQVRVEEMAAWPKERITEFFEALAKVVEIPLRPLPTTIKRAWSKEFEDDDGDEGVVGMSYLYLISILHDGMEQHEKHAVWVLVQHLKRMQARKEAETQSAVS